MAINSTQAETAANDPFTSRWAWRSGALAGFFATFVTAVLTAVTNTGVVWESIAGLYGLEGVLVAGWVAHLFHGTLFGLLFAAFLSDPGLFRLSQWPWKTVLAGVVYGLVLAVVGAGTLMPIWLGLVGFTSPPSLPNVTASLLTWHLVYGVVLGGTFTLLDRGR